MSKRNAVRTVGGYELARTGKAQTQIATEVGVSKVTVHHWCTGDKRPGDELREKLSALYGISPKSWDEPFQKAQRSPEPPKGADDAEAAGGAFAMARALQRQAQAQLDELDEEGANWTPAEKAQVTQRLASTINVLAKITGQYELGRRMLSLPLWKLLEREMFEALKAFPDASSAVADRLEQFERTWLGSSG